MLPSPLLLSVSNGQAAKRLRPRWIESRSAIPFSFPQRLRAGKGGIYLEGGLGAGKESFCEVSAAGGVGDGEWDGERESEREVGSGREEL